MFLGRTLVASLVATSFLVGIVATTTLLVNIPVASGLATIFLGGGELF
jgi:hypothetical protein